MLISSFIKSNIISDYDKTNSINHLNYVGFGRIIQQAFCLAFSEVVVGLDIDDETFNAF